MTIYRNKDGDLWDTAPAADLSADELRTIITETSHTLARHVGEPSGAWAMVCTAGVLRRIRRADSRRPAREQHGPAPAIGAVGQRLNNAPGPHLAARAG